MINYFNTKTSLKEFEFWFDTKPGRWQLTDPEDLRAALKLPENKSRFDVNKWPSYKGMFEWEEGDVIDNDIDSLIDFIVDNKFSKLIYH